MVITLTLGSPPLHRMADTLTLGSPPLHRMAVTLTLGSLPLHRMADTLRLGLAPLLGTEWLTHSHLADLLSPPHPPPGPTSAQPEAFSNANQDHFTAKLPNSIISRYGMALMADQHGTPGRRDPQGKNCLHQTGLWEIFLSANLWRKDWLSMGVATPG